MGAMVLTLLLLAQTLPKSEVRIEVHGDVRTIIANGIPDHTPGTFPNRGNPNSIQVQNYRFTVPANPKPAAQTTDLRHQNFGIALNGVPFDPFTAEFWNGDPQWNYEGIINGVMYLGIDQHHAHVQPTGAYHYHAHPVGHEKNRGSDGTKMVQIGWAADGFPMYGVYGYSDANDPKSPVKVMKSSYRLKKGTRQGGPGGPYDGSFASDFEYVKGLGDLDECNGRTGVTPEFPKGTYYYVVSTDWPWIPRKYRGTPDPSFSRGGPGGPGGRGPGGRRGFPPPPSGGFPPPRWGGGGG
jgi:hypothetical protein